MKNIFKITLVAAFLAVSLIAPKTGWAGGYSSYSRSSRDYGYVYQNPYAASPSAHVSGYTRANGTTVLPYYRTPANQTVTDNLSYRGYGTIRVPRY